MKNNQNDQRHEGYSRDQSDYKMYDEYNILDPDSYSNMQSLDDEDNDLPDFTFMDSSDYQDYDE